MNIVFLSSGKSGFGRLAVGCSLATALRRSGHAHSFHAIAAHEFLPLLDQLGISHTEIPFAPEPGSPEARRRDEELLRLIDGLRPDVLVVGQAWYDAHPILAELTCRKVILFFQASAEYFRIPTLDDDMVFEPNQYDLVCGIEPWEWPIPCMVIEPMVLRNHDEIHSRADAARMLGIDPDRPTALVATNGLPGEFDSLRQLYSYLDDEYQVVYSTNYADGLYPVVDYFNAFDFIACAGGYSAFWEAVYFGKDAVFVPQQRNYEDQAWRINNCQEYEFTRNGADQLVELLLDL